MDIPYALVPSDSNRLDKSPPNDYSPTSSESYPSLCTSEPPINTLPAELLVRIFQTTIDRNQQIAIRNREWPNIYQRTIRLLSVCRSWYCTMLGLGSLWSLVVIYEHQSLWPDPALLKLWLERSAGARLDIILSSTVPQLFNFAPFLQPHADKLRSLNMIESEFNPNGHLLRLWMEPGIYGTLKELSISGISGDFRELPDRYTELERLLRPLLILRLRDLMINCDRPAFSGVVELTIESGWMAEMTGDQLSRSLSACPNVEILNLISFQLTSEASSPILLSRLRKLYISAKTATFVKHTLLAISPGSYNIRLRMHSNLHSLMGERYHSCDNVSRLCPILSLLETVNVTTLILERAWGPYRLRPLLLALPHLHTLYLRNFGLMWDTEMLESITRVPQDISPRLPAIRVMRLLGIVIQNQAAFRNMIQSHGVTDLTIQGSIASLDGNNDLECVVELGLLDEFCVWASKEVPRFVLLRVGEKYDLDPTPDFVQWAQDVNVSKFY